MAADDDIESFTDNKNVERSLSVTSKELSDYVGEYEAKHGDMVCPLCRSTVWAITGRRDSSEHAAILTVPIPLEAGRGMWVYPVICVECGYVATFSTNHVSAKIRGE
ncbi:TPA: hypothetical protein ACNVSH_001566 [Klebsiella aerogenes]|uniref:hypothetical protein n=1 Tax=Klebsiella aerogenes TaxID=548 RepID=UPI000FC9958A|nr:hypothetical protein [Klebsiella aerogenes]EKY0563688.1 hypothetical protein [Klebsiella aerogenes]EKZ5441979.1 hypothetical protein [Klebsiella aerogenes]ELD8587429.1 hypothetical protein [Klebsiella aerogenes]ELI9009172.1 hypothetical protein [Klebsiella aerogenes]ELJ5595908.1 hypothetical protein [Klebsiella aerogenes]